MEIQKQPKASKQSTLYTRLSHIHTPHSSLSIISPTSIPFQAEKHKRVLKMTDNTFNINKDYTHPQSEKRSNVHRNYMCNTGKEKENFYEKFLFESVKLKTLPN